MSTFIEQSWHIWLLAACIIVSLELLLINSYYLLAIAAGTGIAAWAAWLGASPNMQWLSFAGGSFLAFFAMRILRPSTQHSQEHDDISHMTGKLVIVSEDVAPRGRVTYKSVGWAAESNDTLRAGEQARITGVHGSTLFIERVTKESSHGH